MYTWSQGTMSLKSQKMSVSGVSLELLFIQIKVPNALSIFLNTVQFENYTVHFILIVIIFQSSTLTLFFLISVLLSHTGLVPKPTGKVEKA